MISFIHKLYYTSSISSRKSFEKCQLMTVSVNEIVSE